MPGCIDTVGHPPLIRLPPPTGVEPRVSTRPSDPHKRGEGTMPHPLRSPLALAGHVPSPRFYGERVRVRGRACSKAQSCSSIAAAPETVAWPGLSSTLRALTTPSSTSIE
ncbi:hypothetical protein EHI47_15660 [Rhizobium leguminosarum]|uniref:Uncharacterized protein n=2 Tax=Rhizobium TaxID=379 RepID=A0A444HZN0_RHILE|nr:hypothetical protein [Rhizobium leguminosarum bv. viciae]RWX29979.1 hypothetical protein EHI47_15660 [Rhizobium leguminosarum]TAU51913.1 hypothetical protein ELI43_03255 [Rhizobium leguminosarum]TBC71973.1 hypothetical protein ELH27_03405 [Rhizobium leguminosarum]TBE69862.1 hypothetical protein ELH03_03285 [Rhizobium beringeri]